MFITDIVKTNLQTLCLFCAKNCLKRTLNKYICKHISIGRSGKYRLYDKSATAVCLKYIKNYRMNIHELMPKYNPQIQISAESGTKRSIFRQKNKTKRSKKRLHTTLIKPEQKVNEDLCSGFIVS